MLCESCKSAQATVHLTEIINNQKKEVHLCEKCAEKKGITVKAHFSITDLLASLTESAGKSRGGSQFAQMVCPGCGLTFGEFQRKGRFGCAEEYEAFREAIVPLVEKIHGAVQHVGKIPRRADEDVEQKAKVLDLQQRLKRAVELEDYEQAARIRDEIQGLRKRHDSD